MNQCFKNNASYYHHKKVLISNIEQKHQHNFDKKGLLLNKIVIRWQSSFLFFFACTNYHLVKVLEVCAENKKIKIKLFQTKAESFFKPVSEFFVEKSINKGVDNIVEKIKIVEKQQNYTNSFFLFEKEISVLVEVDIQYQFGCEAENIEDTHQNEHPRQPIVCDKGGYGSSRQLFGQFWPWSFIFYDLVAAHRIGA